MHLRHQIAKEGEKEAGVWWHWFISPVGCQEGKGTCPFPLPAQGEFGGVKRCSSLNKAVLWNLMGFHLLLPLHFAVFYHLITLHSAKRGQGGEQGWACVEPSLLEAELEIFSIKTPQSRDLLPKQPGCCRHHPHHPEEAQQLRLHQHPQTLATKPLSHGDRALGTWAEVWHPAQLGMELEFGHFKPPLLQGFLQPWSTCAFGGYF